MITPDILPILRCPADGGQLTLADGELVERINAAIAAGSARDHLDERVTTPIEGGLVNSSANRLYPIRDGIPTLIVDEAIVTTGNSDEQ
ncbi:Trm112 family protein [Rhodopirellula sp. JC740]|uniref:Trm112 family protein n=1 Tax=Rhodopirellula halodulae TaxID=2894198 RepID=A0ABS8NP54_9BACT|nr:Trm112 family protein [Rhodopirellula sp. JC740]MCC9645270.1 Trm112 family protein [Rhodopirellula sp. JC740]